MDTQPQLQPRSRPKLIIIRDLSQPTPQPEPAKEVDLSEVTQDWTILDVATKKTPPTWEPLFEDAFPELKAISNTISIDENTTAAYCFPLRQDIFRAYYLTPVNKIKAIIIGQDPYHQLLPGGLPRATGLSFSVRYEDSIPSSLNNIYTELRNSFHGFSIPSHGNLESWAAQGVFLLNAALTVRPNQAASHKNVWTGFICKTLKYIVKINPKVIFVLWGAEAQKSVNMVGAKVKSIMTSHPSGFSYKKGFEGCDHFNIINQYLVSIGETEIDWRIPEPGQK